jgi:hypothetical protein
MPAVSVSDCELTDTYSPAAIDSAPATKPASAATITEARSGCAAATPTTRLLVEMSPSFAPRTVARSQPMLLLLCVSECDVGMDGPGKVELQRQEPKGRTRMTPIYMQVTRISEQRRLLIRVVSVRSVLSVFRLFRASGNAHGQR